MAPSKRALKYGVDEKSYLEIVALRFFAPKYFETALPGVDQPLVLEMFFHYFCHKRRTKLNQLKPDLFGWMLVLLKQLANYRILVNEG